MAEHVKATRKGLGTAEFLPGHSGPHREARVGTTKADKLPLQVGRLHSSLSETRFQANRVLAVVGSMYAFAGRAGIVPKGPSGARNPQVRGGPPRAFPNQRRNLERLGIAIREGETGGIPWTVGNRIRADRQARPKVKTFHRKLSRPQQRRFGCFFSTAPPHGKSLHLRRKHVDGTWRSVPA